MKKLVIFDMDGTLNRIERFIIPTYKEVLRRFDGSGPVPDEQVLRLMGLVDQDIYRGLVPDADMARFDEFMALVVEEEFRNIDLYAESFAGVPEMLRALFDAGYLLAVCSNGTTDYVHKITEALGIQQYFTYLQGAVDGHTKADNVGDLLARCAPDAAVMVGDRVQDMQAAAQNGIAFVGCQYWFMPEEVADAAIRVEAAGQIPDAVRRAIG